MHADSLTTLSFFKSSTYRLTELMHDDQLPIHLSQKAKLVSILRTSYNFSHSLSMLGVFTYSLLADTTTYRTFPFFCVGNTEKNFPCSSSKCVYTYIHYTYISRSPLFIVVLFFFFGKHPFILVRGPHLTNDFFLCLYEILL